MKVQIVGAGKTSLKRAEEMVADGSHCWCWDYRTNSVSKSRIERAVSRDKFNEPRIDLGPVVPFNDFTDAFPGRPVLWTLGYDRRSTGGHQTA